MTGDLAAQLVEQSDPANAALLGMLWWRLDRRLRALRADLERLAQSEG